MAKTLGMIIIVIGIILSVITYQPIAETLGLALPASLNNTLTMVGIGAIGVGIVLLAFTGRKQKQPAEVPIYHGKNIVGFRRMGKQ